jgi:hypothetical protein
MRLACLGFALLAAACSGNSLPGNGDGPPAPLDLAGCAPNCPDLFQPPVDLAAPAPDFSGVDLANTMCVPTCNHCTTGGACCPGAPNGGCCNTGEWCDNGTCRCNGGAACANGEVCASGGPAPGPGGNQCGVICCGGPNHPCPL